MPEYIGNLMYLGDKYNEKHLTIQKKNNKMVKIYQVKKLGARKEEARNRKAKQREHKIGQKIIQIQKKNHNKGTRLHSLVQSYRISNLIKQKVFSHMLFKGYIYKYQANDCQK